MQKKYYSENIDIGKYLIRENHVLKTIFWIFKTKMNPVCFPTIPLLYSSSLLFNWHSTNFKLKLWETKISYNALKHENGVITSGKKERKTAYLRIPDFRLYVLPIGYIFQFKILHSMHVSRKVKNYGNIYLLLNHLNSRSMSSVLILKITLLYSITKVRAAANC